MAASSQHFGLSDAVLELVAPIGEPTSCSCSRSATALQVGRRGVDHMQHRLGGCPHGGAVPRPDHHRQLGPQPPGRTQVELYGAARRHAELGGPAAQQAHRVEFDRIRLASGRGRIAGSVR